MTRVLVTGAAGFVGCRVVERLLGEGLEVIGIDSFDEAYPRDHKVRALAELAGRCGFRFVEGNVLDRHCFGPLVRGAQVVVHAAGRAGVRSSIADAAGVARANVYATAAVVTTAQRAGVRRLVHLSSSSVYGNAPTPFAEDTAWLRPASPYAASKRAAELVMARAVRTGARVAMLRLFSVYGPGQRPDQAAWQFASRLAAREPVAQYGDGSALRDFTYVGDVAQAVSRAVAWTAADAPQLLVANVGAGQPVRVDHFRALLASALGVPDRAEWRQAAPGDVRATAARVDRARTTLGWTATTPLARGIADFVDWFEVTHGRPARTTARSGA